MRKRGFVHSIIGAVTGILLGTAVYAGPPAESGVVVREDGEFAGILVDREAGLLLAVGFDPKEYCSGMGDFDILTVMGVYVPAPIEAGGERVFGELRASVWDFVQFNCDLFLAMSPLAEGMASANWGQKNGFKNYGATYNGTLYDPMTGAPMRMHGILRIHFDGEEDLVRVQKITLN